MNLPRGIPPDFGRILSCRDIAIAYLSELLAELPITEEQKQRIFQEAGRACFYAVRQHIDENSRSHGY